MIPKFNIFFCCDSEGNFDKSGVGLPFENQIWGKFINNEIKKNDFINYWIIGKNTYEKMYFSTNPTVKNKNLIVLSSTMTNKNTNNEIVIFKDLFKCLSNLSDTIDDKNKKYTISLMGGFSLITYAIENYLYMCDKIFIFIDNDKLINDSHSKFNFDTIKHIKYEVEPKGETCELRTYYSKIIHEEYAYINLINEIILNKQINKLFNKLLIFKYGERTPICTIFKLNFPLLQEQLVNDENNFINIILSDNNIIDIKKELLKNNHFGSIIKKNKKFDPIYIIINLDNEMNILCDLIYDLCDIIKIQTDVVQTCILLKHLETNASKLKKITLHLNVLSYNIDYKDELIKISKRTPKPYSKLKLIEPDDNILNSIFLLNNYNTYDFNFKYEF